MMILRIGKDLVRLRPKEVNINHEHIEKLTVFYIHMRVYPDHDTVPPLGRHPGGVLQKKVVVLGVDPNHGVKEWVKTTPI